MENVSKWVSKYVPKNKWVFEEIKPPIKGQMKEKYLGASGIPRGCTHSQ